MHETSTEDILKAQKDKEKLSEIINKNAGLIWSIIKRFTNRGIDIEELYQIGCMGFIKAIQRFKIEYNVKLSTYAVPYILGEVKRFVRDDGMIKVSRSVKELSMKILAIQREYLNTNGKEIRINDIAEKLKVSKEEIIEALDSIRPIDSIDEDMYKEDNKGESKLSKINNGKDEINLLVNKICLKELINSLKEKEKQVILLRYFKDKTQTEVAKVLGITQVQVSRIEKKILLGMREKIIS